MSFQKDEVIERLKKTYGYSYDIKSYDEAVDGLQFEGEFHVHSEKYVLSKKAQLYQMDSNEYTYVYYYPHLTKDLFDAAINDAYDKGFPNIKPSSDHRCSYIVGIFICDTFDDDAYIALKKYRRRQSFQFSLHGWMEVHTAMIDMRSESVMYNSDGRQTGKFLKKILHPKKRRKSLFILKN